MAKRIEGITIEIGGDTIKLNKALAGVNKEIGSTQKELKEVERLLKLEPTNIELLTQKEQLLNETLENQKKKAEGLKKAYQEVAKSAPNYDAYKKAVEPYEAELAQATESLKKLRNEQQKLADVGEIDSEQYKSVTKDVEALTQKTSDLRKKVEEVWDEFGNPVSPEGMRKLQRDLISATQKTKDLEEQANKSRAALAKLSARAEKVSSASQKVASTMRPVTTAVAGLATAAIATVPATQELRADLSKLDQNAKENGVSIEAAREAWRAFTVQSGETDSAIEATSNLLQAGFTESNLQKAVEGLAGAYIRFPDTLKIESLADSLQETLATGEATGQFGELLDRLGIGADNFSAQLEKCTTDAQKQNLALQTLSQAGLTETYKAWLENNQAMADNQEATISMQEQLAEFAETIQPFITAALQGLTQALKWFNDLPGPVQAVIGVLLLLVGAIGPVASGISGFAKITKFMAETGIPALGKALGAIPGVLSGVSGAVSSFASFIISNPIALIIAAIVALVALIALKGDEIQALLGKFNDWLQGVFAKDWREVFGDTLGGYLNTFFDVFGEIWDGIHKVLNGVIDLIRGVFTGDWDRAWKGVKEIFEGIWDSFVAIAKAPLKAIIGLLNIGIDNLNNLIDKINSIKISLPDWLGGWSWSPSIPHIPNIPELAKGTSAALRGLALVGERGPELVMMRGGEQVFTANQTRAILQGGVSSGGNVSIGNMTINPSAGQWGQLMELLGQWQGARQQRRAR